jgi:hypothetical protein
MKSIEVIGDFISNGDINIKHLDFINRMVKFFKKKPEHLVRFKYSKYCRSESKSEYVYENFKKENNIPEHLEMVLFEGVDEENNENYIPRLLKFDKSPTYFRILSRINTDKGSFKRYDFEEDDIEYFENKNDP